MKSRLISTLACLICLSMLIGALAACRTDKPDTESSTEQTTDVQTEQITGDDVEDITEEDTSPKLEGNNALLIENAERLQNGVNVYYTDASRTSYVVENKNMSFEYSLDPSAGQQVTAIKNAKGASYLEDTMDVFVKMTDGKTYYASRSTDSARVNIFRLGYYYYDIRILDQGFSDSLTVSREYAVKLPDYNYYYDMSSPKFTNGVLISKCSNALDTHIVYDVNYPAEDYNYVAITLKASGTITRGELFMLADGRETMSGTHKLMFYVKNDGEFHTYYIPMSSMPDYRGTVTQLRVDLSGQTGDAFEIKDIKAVQASTGDAPAIYLDRTLHTYSDKMNQVLHFVAETDTNGIAELGMITSIKTDTVDKLIVKDKNGLHDKIDGVDWASAEYIGFDIKNVGVFGYILLKHETSGKITVSLEGDSYVITQASTPNGGIIKAPVNDTSNDFYMGQRIYTDASHDFASFLHEADCERNPLTSDNVTVDKEKSPDSQFVGYDPLRGTYCFTLPGTDSFNYSYYEHPNQHFNVAFTVKGDDRDRKIYIQTYAYSTNIECGAVLDENGMLLPVAMEVCKNFVHEKEEPLFDRGDARYSETYIPVKLCAGESITLNILNLYQNWGKYPLKQLSSIQTNMPYYHLSTGVSESNCIAPYYVFSRNLETLPDHRAASAPMWSEVPNHPDGNQPQFTNGGYHYFLQYTDADGSYSASETLSSKILCAGPTYAEVVMDYLSDDGKIKVSYTHLEMPQTDENRTYYTMKYEVLEDVTIKNFAEDFSFYKMIGFGNYAQVGYLDASGTSKVRPVNTKSKPLILTLGKQFPYFDCYQLTKGDLEDYVNLSCLIYDSDITIGGEKCTASFVVVDYQHSLSLSLDLGEVTLKKGDLIEINMILMPWGSQLSTDDSNVRRVRENSLINSLKVEAGANTTAIDSTFLPRVRSTNGKTAEFTLSGGENNVTVRVYGFDKLTAPKIYEKIDGEWVEYEVSSANSPDQNGHANYYDGYGVHYDGDGTFSYSFVTAMNNGAPRTFKLVAEEDFEPWPEELPEKETESLFNTILEGELLKSNSGNSGSSLGAVTVMEDGEYVRFFGNNLVEAYANLTFTGVTGQYAVIKYRLPTTNPESAGLFNIFTSTVNAGATGDGDFMETYAIVKNGEWQVMVIDLAKFGLKNFAPDANGNYSVQYMRFDMFNQVTSESSYIDIAYVALCDSFEDAIAANLDMETVTLVEDSKGSTTIYTATGTSVPSLDDVLDLYFSPTELLSFKTHGGSSLGEVKLADDSSYIRYYGDGKYGENYTYINIEADKPTGQFVVIRYRLPSTNAETGDKFQIYIGTKSKDPTDAGGQMTTTALYKDDKWHTLVIDLADFNLSEFAASEDGSYTAQFMRFDMFNQLMSTESYIDIAYVGMCDSIDKALTANSDLDAITLVSSRDSSEEIPTK
ncbi:MAG: hypothetical protein IJY39_11745 [Clostridia bacterium]|nr:hypothetical protein [Clostridia bacterium]